MVKDQMNIDFDVNYDCKDNLIHHYHPEQVVQHENLV
jgi:hypothetical protein